MKKYLVSWLKPLGVILILFSLLSPGHSASFAGAGIEVDGVYIGGNGGTWAKESRKELIERLSSQPLTFERDYVVPVTKDNPDQVTLTGKIRLLSRIRGDREEMATARTLTLVKKKGRWYVSPESLKAALEPDQKKKAPKGDK